MGWPICDAFSRWICVVQRVLKNHAASQATVGEEDVVTGEVNE